MGRILDSYYANLREMQLFFYYPTDEYISYMMTVDELMFVDEIDCKDLFPGEWSAGENCDFWTEEIIQAEHMWELKKSVLRKT